MKYSFTGTGTSSEVTQNGRSGVLYFCDFSTGSGVGTVQIECEIHPDFWVPVDEPTTTDMEVVEVAHGTAWQELTFRWRCTAHSTGTIDVYLL